MINTRHLRHVLPASAVVVTMLLALYWQFTLPRMERLETLQARYEALSEGPRQAAASATEAVGPDEEQVIELVRRIESLNAQTADPTSAYDRLISLARQAGLQVESITPSRAESAGERIHVMGWTMVATASFAKVVEFVDLLAASDGLQRIASMRLTPAMGGDPALLTLTLSVEFARVVIPDDLRTPKRAGAPAIEGEKP